MRREVTDRIYRVFTYQPVDRVPDIEFGYWPQTIRRWLREGMPLELTPEETNQMFCRKVDDFFGFEREGVGVPSRCGINPVFESQVIERKERSVIKRTGDGIIAEWFEADVEESSIPHFLEFPVKTPDDWRAMKERYRRDDPVRHMTPEKYGAARRGAREGRMVSIGFTGFYGQLRNWMGMENLSYAFYEEPAMIHDMVVHWADLLTAMVEQAPDDIPIDFVSWWEDMAGRNGPLVSPRTFREFLQPGYRQVMTAAKKKGCVISHVDCDGNPHDIVGNWLEEGVNIMFPIEIGAGADPAAWRREFGRELRLRGGIDKRAIAAGAIDAEIERIRPLLADGGCIPHLDHLVPPDISYDNYRRYLDAKRRLIGA